MLTQGFAAWQHLLSQSEEALAAEAWEDLKHLLHNITGSAANLRAVKLAELATTGILQMTNGDKENVGKILTEIRAMISNISTES